MSQAFSREKGNNIKTSQTYNTVLSPDSHFPAAAFWTLV